MKIKTITCHDVYNHGASLQAFALQNYLSCLGHDIEIIDYKPNYLSRHYDFFYVSNPRWNKYIVLKIIYLVLKLPMRLLALKKKRSFDKFRDSYLYLTAKRYNTNKELQDSLPEADLFIAGSDQIWNTLYPNGKDAAFYLNFVPKRYRKLSYAASFATSTIAEQYKDFVCKQLCNFDSISVREEDGLRLLEELGHKGIWVCDPVFLLSTTEWDKIIERPFNEKYIIIYDFERTPLIEKVAKQIAKKNGWKIYTINVFLAYANKCFTYSGPQDFVSLIKNAQLIISNSFHATAFSVIYEKEFFVVPRKEGINTRMASLLSYLEIPDRMITTNEFKYERIDYNKVRVKMNAYIAQSKKFLKDNIIL
ncbi:MAG: polysaccharide pyruvyl transferase family protein [Odoribacter sp.]